MKTAIQQSRLQELIARRNGYLVLSVGLLLLCILLSIMVLRLIGRERIIITPPVVHRSFWVDNQQVSPEYLTEMTAFLAQLRLTVTPTSAEYQRETLLRYTDASYYGEFKNELVAEADHLNKSHVSLAFYPTHISVDAPNLTAHITGDLVSTVGNAPLPPARITYQVRYRYTNGQLRLQSFQEQQEDKPHA